MSKLEVTITGKLNVEKKVGKSGEVRLCYEIIISPPTLKVGSVEVSLVDVILEEFPNLERGDIFTNRAVVMKCERFSLRYSNIKNSMEKFVKEAEKLAESVKKFVNTVIENLQKVNEIVSKEKPPDADEKEGFWEGFNFISQFPPVVVEKIEVMGEYATVLGKVVTWQGDYYFAVKAEFHHAPSCSRCIPMWRVMNVTFKNGESIPKEEKEQLKKVVSVKVENALNEKIRPI